MRSKTNRSNHEIRVCDSLIPCITNEIIINEFIICTINLDPKIIWGIHEHSKLKKLKVIKLFLYKILKRPQPEYTLYYTNILNDSRA